MERSRKNMPLCLLVLVLIVCVTWITPATRAAAVVSSGTCGENLSWEFDDAGTLTIFGTGAMDDYSVSSMSPWYNGDQYAIKAVDIQSGVTSIGIRAFYCNYALKNITIPVTVTEIGEGAFVGCFKLTNIYYEGSQTQWESISVGAENDYLDMAIVHFAGGAEPTEPDASEIEIVVDGTCGYGDDDVNWKLDNFGTLTIYGSGYMANFNDYGPWHDFSPLRKVVIESGVLSVGRDAFAQCYEIRSVTIADTVTRINSSAFENCYRLESVDIPDGLSVLASRAFAHCANLQSVTIGSDVTTIETNVFSWCESLKAIWVDADNDAFSSDDNGVLFNKDKTMVLEVPCAISGHYTIPNSVTTIGQYAFSDCVDLQSVTIPNSVTTIDYLAFYSCTGLQDVFYLGSEEQWNGITVGGGNIPLSNATMHYVDVQEEQNIGDYTGDDAVNNDDVTLLLWNTLFPEDYPLAANADLTGDGAVNNDDVVLLLWHTLFPEDYPL